MASSNNRAGYFYKCGGSGGKWKKRYFVLNDSTLRYYKNEESKKEKGCIELSEGRGVREKDQCKVKWPSEANDLCFGLATESRTYYLYATDTMSIGEWVTEIQQVIEKIGKKSDDWENDIEGKPESKKSKGLRSAVQFATNVTKTAASHSGVLSEDQLAALDSAANIIENQAAADPNTNWKDRVKMGMKDGAGAVGHGLNIAGDFIPDEYGKAAAGLVGDVLVDQSEADGDLSGAQRLGLAAGSAFQGAAGLASNVKPLAKTLDMAGDFVKDQALGDNESAGSEDEKEKGKKGKGAKKAVKEKAQKGKAAAKDTKGKDPKGKAAAKPVTEKKSKAAPKAAAGKTPKGKGAPKAAAKGGGSKMAAGLIKKGAKAAGKAAKK